jgi:hypothetical protein
MTYAALALIALAVGLLAAVFRLARPASSGVVRHRPVPSPARRPVREQVPHLLYCYRRPDGRRIYGGISNCPKIRHARHEVGPDDRWWFVQSDGVMYPIRWYPNRAEAKVAEIKLIQTMHYSGEEPANFQHNPGRRRVAR